MLSLANVKLEYEEPTEEQEFTYRGVKIKVLTSRKKTTKIKS